MHEGWMKSEEWGTRIRETAGLGWCCGVSRGGRRMTEAVGGYRGRVEESRQKEVEEGGLGGWLVMHCANSPRRGHVTRTPGLSLIAPRRNVGHTVPTKHCTLHLSSFRRTSARPDGGGGERGGEVVDAEDVLPGVFRNVVPPPLLV